MNKAALLASALFALAPLPALAEPVLLISIDGLRPGDVLEADKRGLALPASSGAPEALELVEDDQVGRTLLQLFDAARAVGRVREGEARLRQVLAHHLRQAGVVFDHQELGGRHASHDGRRPASRLECSVKMG